MTLPLHQNQRVAADEFQVKIELPEELKAFKGHFPGNPILPGVVQIDWAMRLAAMYFGLELATQKFQVKFNNIIIPLMPLTLTLKLDRPKERLSFAYQVEDKVMSTGLIKLQGLV